MVRVDVPAWFSVLHFMRSMYEGVTSYDNLALARRKMPYESERNISIQFEILEINASLDFFLFSPNKDSERHSQHSLL